MPAFEGLVSILGPKGRVWSLAYSRFCLYFCKELSYRQAAYLMNTVLHRSKEDSLKANTLAEFVDRVGGNIQDYLQAVSEAILKEHYFEQETAWAEGEPSIHNVVAQPKSPHEQKLWEDEISKKVEEINAQREPREQIRNLEYFPHMESSQEKCCYISIDEIGVKHQKETRKGGGDKSGKYVQNTVVHIQSGDAIYYLTASSMDTAFRMLVAFLQSNNLTLGYSLVFLADGAKNIKNYIEKYFSFHPYTLVLDWYHLKKKCKELISSALGGTKKQKSDYTRILLRMLWVGNVKEAISYLNRLDGSCIKSSHWLGELIGYLERKEPQIVCYALRHGIGLRISSNRVEKANDLLVAQRQKDNGMSWSLAGSSSLASITMVIQNNEIDQWLRTQSLAFSMPGSMPGMVAA